MKMYTGGFTATNGYLLELDKGAMLIDAPHGVEQWDGLEGVDLKAVVLTHQHFDHVLGVGPLMERYEGLQVFGHSAYNPELTLEAKLGDLTLPRYEVGRLLAGEAVLELGGRRFEISYVPGHAVDSLCFYEPAEKRVFAGDTLFAGGIGRTDFPMGSMAQLVTGIRQHLYALPEETAVFSGHGPDTTIGAEQQDNPFVG